MLVQCANFLVKYLYRHCNLQEEFGGFHAKTYRNCFVIT